MTLHIALCDDDNLALESEARLLRVILNNKAIKYELEVFNSPNKLLEKDVDYDMLFLDIEMNEISGIDIARIVMEEKKNCYIFFLTNYSVYLDRALDVNALRFLTKPVDAIRLSNGIDTALERIQAKAKTIRVTTLENRHSLDIEISNILFISNLGRHTEITTKKSCFQVEEIFSKIKNRIESEVSYFAMPHQSFFVNLNYVTAHNKNEVVITYSGKKYKTDVSRRQYNAFDKKMFVMANDL